MTITIVWVPTVPHCHLALTIALSIRVKLMRELEIREGYKIDIKVKEGTHNTKKEIDK